jgi:hypothetical protein
MPAPKRYTRHADDIRAKIKTTLIVNRLQNHISGKNKMTTTQVRAAEILLNKVVPNLQSVEMDVSGDIVQNVVSTQPLSEAEWAKAYSDSVPAALGGNGTGETAH